MLISFEHQVKSRNDFLNDARTLKETYHHTRTQTHKHTNTTHTTHTTHQHTHTNTHTDMTYMTHTHHAKIKFTRKARCTAPTSLGEGRSVGGTSLSGTSTAGVPCVVWLSGPRGPQESGRQGRCPGVRRSSQVERKPNVMSSTLPGCSALVAAHASSLSHGGCRTPALASRNARPKCDPTRLTSAVGWMASPDPCRYVRVVNARFLRAVLVLLGPLSECPMSSITSASKSVVLFLERVVLQFPSQTTSTIPMAPALMKMREGVRCEQWDNDEPWMAQARERPGRQGRRPRVLPRRAAVLANGAEAKYIKNISVTPSSSLPTKTSDLLTRFRTLETHYNKSRLIKNDPPFASTHP